MGDETVLYKDFVGKPEGKRPVGRPGVDGRRILRWIFSKLGLGAWAGSSWLRIGTVRRHF
jgi:hypothetical protein